MSETKELLEIFVDRPHQFRLLEKGLRLLEPNMQSFNNKYFMEAGCAYGDASAYLSRTYDCHVVGVDNCGDSISSAKRIHSSLINQGLLEFCTEDVEALTFKDGRFNGIFMEAAFSPLKNKANAAFEFYRVLKPGGKVLLNDFALRKHEHRDMTLNTSDIPCFRGVGSMEDYRDIFEAQGFREIYAAEEYGEFIALTLWVSKAFHVKLNEVGHYLSTFHKSGGGQQELGCKGGDEDHITKANLTYCQMILEKR